METPLPSGLFPALALLALASPAHAARISAACQNAELLNEQAKICADNHLYQSAAERCVSELRALVETQKAATRATLARQANQVAAERGQALDLRSSAAGYGSTTADFASLVSEADTAAASLTAYRDGVVFPFDWVDHNEEQEDFFANVWSQPCYASAAARLDDLRYEVATMRAQLVAGQRATEQLGTVATARKAELNGRIANAAVSATRGKGPVAAGVKTQRQPSSTITGRIRNERVP